MIRIIDVSKSYGSQVLFKDLNITVGPGEKVGLVGRNGHGKTTLFTMILGKTEADSGSVVIPRDYRIGHLEQHIRFTKESVLDEACLGLRESDRDSHWKAEKILSGLGFSAADMRRSPGEFSGGYQIRINLAKVLLSEPDMLLLDEPNNYLDIVAIRWLEGFLRSWKSELMLITHDRGFMDRVITHTVALHRQRARKVEGDTGKLYDQIAREEEVYEKTRLNEEKKRKQTELFIRRFRAKARLAGMVQSRLKSLEKQERREKLDRVEDLEFSFTPAPFPAARMAGVHNLRFSYGGGEPWLVDRLSLDIGKRERICIIGRNGRGKSTLLRILAGELSPVGGSVKRHPELKVAYFAQTNAARLSEQKTVYEEILDADPECEPARARGICGAMMFGGDRALKPVGVLSGGEKSRVMLGRTLVTPSNLLLLDEPTNHLDMESCESLIDAVDAFDGSVVMVTHNEDYLHAVAERLIVFDRDRVTVFEGTYAEFLEREGWNDEDDARAEKRNGEETSSGTGRKALKRARAELLQEKSRALKPLEAEIRRLEDDISRLERELHDATEGLVRASTEGDAEAIAALSKRSADLKPEIDALYDDLDALMRSFEEKESWYRDRMDGLGD